MGLLLRAQFIKEVIQKQLVCLLAILTVYNYASHIKINQPTIKEWFTGIDYTLELSSYGQLRFGVTKRLLGVFNYQNGGKYIGN